MTVQDQDGGAQTVDIFHDEGDRVPEFGLRIATGRFRRHVITRILLYIADVSGVAAAERVLEQSPGPNTAVAGFPDSVTLEARDGEGALRLAAATAAFHHALKRFQGVES